MRRATWAMDEDAFQVEFQQTQPGAGDDAAGVTWGRADGDGRGGELRNVPRSREGDGRLAEARRAAGAGSARAARARDGGRSGDQQHAASSRMTGDWDPGLDLGPGDWDRGGDISDPPIARGWSWPDLFWWLR